MIKNPLANAGDVRDARSIPGSGRSPGGGNGSPLRYACLENPTDRGAWLGGSSPWGRTESDTIEASQHAHSADPASRQKLPPGGQSSAPGPPPPLPPSPRLSPGSGLSCSQGPQAQGSSQALPLTPHLWPLPHAGPDNTGSAWRGKPFSHPPTRTAGLQGSPGAPAAHFIPVGPHEAEL